MKCKRDITVGDMVAAAVRQGKELDFRFVPLTAADRKKSEAQRYHETFGPVLEELGLLDEEGMRMTKSKATKDELRSKLWEALQEADKLRERVWMLETVEGAAKLLADRFVDHMNATCGHPGVDNEDATRTRKSLCDFLYRLSDANRMVLILQDSNGGTHATVAGAHSSNIEVELSFAEMLEKVQREFAEVMVRDGGALKLVRRALEKKA
jgi:hypothetical protein